jgi:hypothetical protein
MPSLPEPRIYAPIEDLDPEPVGPGRRLRRREVALGMLLLVGVLLFAGWDWQRQEGQATAYRAGEQAALAREWDAAEAAFRSVGTYRDAAQRAAQAAATQAERDRRYAAAQSALGAGDYLGALAAVEAVAQVQPGYRDTAALAEQARAPLLRAVLSGTVAQRPAAQPPGLYRYGAAGWEWLAGSDGASQVQATGAPGYVLYDGPNPDLPRAGARVLVRADLQRDPAETATFTLNPADFSGYRVGADGVWGIRDSHLRVPALASVQGYGNLDLTYQATADPRFQALILPGPDWLVLDLAPDGRHYLLADLSRATGGDAPTSLLYLAGGASRPQALYAVPGLLRRAQFSPDGRWVLLVSTQAQAGGPATCRRCNCWTGCNWPGGRCWTRQRCTRCCGRRGGRRGSRAWGRRSWPTGHGPGRLCWCAGRRRAARSAWPIRPRREPRPFPCGPSRGRGARRCGCGPEATGGWCSAGMGWQIMAPTERSSM